jgi:hypothetical protein
MLTMSNNPQSDSAPGQIAPTVKKFRLGDQPSDFAYWQSQPYAARLAALEELRRPRSL